MEQFHIHGPTRIQGRVRPAGAKNAALPALAASLLTEEPLTLGQLPKVRDIRTMRKLLEHLGVESRTTRTTNQAGDGNGGNDSLLLQPSGQATTEDAPYELVKTMRAGVLVLGPLLARTGRARVSLPGGCAIGVRPIDQHLAGLQALGAEVSLEHGYITASASSLVGGRFRFNTTTVTGTENLMMAACLAKGTTRLENCAREPEIVDLAQLLTRMGAQIQGAGDEVIQIQGVPSLSGAAHDIIPDRIEGGTYLIAAAMTQGDIDLQGARAADLLPLLEKLHEAGCEIQTEDDSIRLRSSGSLSAKNLVTSPHPGFPTDLQAQYMSVMTQAEGTATICETVFENRYQHVPELIRMGAEIEIDGSNAKVHGPTTLLGANVMATDLRASACLVLAGLAAEGTTIVDRIYHLDRGYEQMEVKLSALGAHVERINPNATSAPNAPNEPSSPSAPSTG